MDNIVHVYLNLVAVCNVEENGFNSNVYVKMNYFHFYTRVEEGTSRTNGIDAVWVKVLGYGKNLENDDEMSKKRNVSDDFLDIFSVKDIDLAADSEKNIPGKKEVAIFQGKTNVTIHDAVNGEAYTKNEKNNIDLLAFNIPVSKDVYNESILKFFIIPSQWH